MQHRQILLVILAVLIAAAAGVYAIFARDLAGARVRLVGRSKTVETALGRLEYAMIGEGELMLIVHGAAGGFDQGLDMTGALAGSGYWLIAPSRFGYLRSTLPDGLTTAMQADAYAQLLDRLGVDKVVVVAISVGAWSSLQFAIRHPGSCVQQVLEHLLPVSLRLAGMNFDIKTAATHEPYLIEKIACPVLTISAEDDRFGTASRAKFIAASVPDGRAIIFPTGGHALVGHYADALREIVSFLRTVQERRSLR